MNLLQLYLTFHPIFQPNKLLTKNKPVEEVVKHVIPKVPYLGRLIKQKTEEQFSKFINLLKQLQINLPFVEVLHQMPKYSKFMRDFLSNKRKIEELHHVGLGEVYSAALLYKLPKKQLDLGSFTIPCSIGGLCVGNTLANLGASINLMPSSMFKKLGLGKPSPTRMSIQLAGRSVKYPKGIAEDLLVKVGKFVFPSDFVILDMEEDQGVPLILGRPFLAISGAIVYMSEKMLTLRVGDGDLRFGMGQ
ncbi:hypothetical protein L1987_05936 [Smallanthus sonchifolius]|uniref:Uncharacterized protein n=1 Tax=Smallanthus sonchifolius TaxID=185202 RepID=A0ACB9JWQ5_9ASTR|nr:hypothetical protein L1987_05936 [Smallanthus sonchifolius]